MCVPRNGTMIVSSVFKVLISLWLCKQIVCHLKNPNILLFSPTHLFQTFLFCFPLIQNSFCFFFSVLLSSSNNVYIPNKCHFIPLFGTKIKINKLLFCCCCCCRPVIGKQLYCSSILLWSFISSQWSFLTLRRSLSVSQLLFLDFQFDLSPT